MTVMQKPTLRETLRFVQKLAVTPSAQPPKRLVTQGSTYAGTVITDQPKTRSLADTAPAVDGAPAATINAALDPARPVKTAPPQSGAEQVAQRARSQDARQQAYQQRYEDVARQQGMDVNQNGVAVLTDKPSVTVTYGQRPPGTAPATKAGAPAPASAKAGPQLVQGADDWLQAISQPVAAGNPRAAAERYATIRTKYGWTPEQLEQFDQWRTANKGGTWQGLVKDNNTLAKSIFVANQDFKGWDSNAQALRDATAQAGADPNGVSWGGGRLMRAPGTNTYDLVTDSSIIGANVLRRRAAKADAALQNGAATSISNASHGLFGNYADMMKAQPAWRRQQVAQAYVDQQGRAMYADRILRTNQQQLLAYAQAARAAAQAYGAKGVTPDQQKVQQAAWNKAHIGYYNTVRKLGLNPSALTYDQATGQFGFVPGANLWADSSSAITAGTALPGLIAAPQATVQQPSVMGQLFGGEKPTEIPAPAFPQQAVYAVNG